MNSKRGDYLADILSSVDIDSSSVYGEKSVRQLKDETENLVKVKDLLEEFEKSQSNLFQQHTKEHVKFVKKLGDKQRRVLNSLFLTYRKQVGGLFEYQSINETLDILAYYLGLLKVTVISKDFKTSKRLMAKFLSQEDLNLSFLMEQVKEFEENIRYFRLSYLNVISALSNYLGLEQKAELQFKNTTGLSELLAKQKALLKQVGMEFTKVSKMLLKDKEYREFLNK